MVATNTAVMLVLLLLLQLCNYSGVSSFVISTPTIAQRHVGLSAPAFSRPLPGAGAATASVVLFAKKGKKRRKRKETSVSTPDDAAVVETDDNNNELVAQEVEAATMEDLPEFDLAEEEPEPVVSEPAESVVASVSPPSGTVLDGSSSSAMMGGGGGGSGAPVQPLGSVQDLIADRSIEKLMNFEEPESLDVPDFNDYLAKRGTKSGDILPPPGMGKKKARQLQRQQAAMARQQEEEDSKSFLDNIPFLLNEKGEVTAVKILEAGAWLGIGLLVLWEVYLNSPFFDRAAPMAPVVFRDAPENAVVVPPPPPPVMDAVGGGVAPPPPTTETMVVPSME